MSNKATIAGTAYMPLLIIVLAIAVAGCQTAHEKLEKQNAAARKFNDQRNAAYKAYLTDDIDHAGQDLLRLADLGEAGKEISPRNQALHLTRAYDWLFAFEERTGNTNLADVYFKEATYWRIRMWQLDGDSDSDIGAKLGTFTREEAISYVDEWDRGASNGKGPFYLTQIGSKKSTAKQAGN